MSLLERVAVEAQYFAPADLEELRSVTRAWAEVTELPSRAEELAYRDMLGSATVAVGSPRPAWLAGTSLKLLQLAGAGYEDFIGLDRGANRQLVICNARGVFSIGIAEHVIALMLAFCRDLPHLMQSRQNSDWSPRQSRFGELTGQTVVIVGLGDVGNEIAKRACGMGMTVIGVRRTVQSADIPPYLSAIVPTSQWYDALQAADHVVAALPGAPGTRHLIDARAVAHIKNGAYFYNVGRGTTVDEHALMRALDTGRIAGAGLDVFSNEPLSPTSPLWKMPQVIVTPHVAGYSAGCVRRFGRLVSENLQRYYHGKPLRNVIPAAEIFAQPITRR